MIDCTEGLIEAIRNNAIINMKDQRFNSWITANEFIEGMFCPVCGDVRKHKVKCAEVNRGFGIDKSNNIKLNHFPFAHTATCLQCDAKTQLVLYEGPENIELAILRNHYGGCVTEHTPYEVKFYIDQASRARMMGALSAAMAMYRSALEWILYNQGYTTGMLGKRIEALKNDIEHNNAPGWADSINPMFFTAIKNIGNGAIHTNDGDISRQSTIDKKLIETVDIVLAELLDVIYEQPFRRKNNLDKLKAASESIKE